MRGGYIRRDIPPWMINDIKKEEIRRRKIDDSRPAMSIYDERPSDDRHDRKQTGETIGISLI